MTQVAEQQVPFIDVFGEEYVSDPYRVLREARERSWIARTPHGMMVLSYEAMQELFADKRVLPPGGIIFRVQGIDSGPAYDWWSNMLFAKTGKDHLRLRTLLASSFSPKRIAAYRDGMRERAEKLIGSIEAGQVFDFVETVSDPFPIGVFCDVLGIPSEDLPRFSRWSTDLGVIGNFQLATDLPIVDGAVAGLYEYAESLINERRENLGDDLLSGLLRAEEAGERLDNDELKSLIVVLLFGGHDTTRQQIGISMATFLKRPDQWEKLRADRGLTRNAVEEILRWSPSVIDNTRFASEEVEHRGVTIPKDTYIAFNSGAANRDGAFMTRPEDLDITREPSRHLTFGKGPHICLGSAIARAELEVLFDVLIERMPEIRPEGEPEWRSPVGIYGPERLPMSYTAG